MGSRANTRLGGILIGLLTIGLLLPQSIAPAQAAPIPVLPAKASGKRIGDWQVQNLSGDTWRVTWRSPKALPITSDRPTIVRSGRPIGTPTVIDNRLVSTEVRSTQAPDPTKLEVVLSGDRISRSGQDTPEVKVDGSSFTPGTLLPFDPATPGAFETATSDYQGDPVPVEGFENPVEFVGHVVEPKLSENTGPRPVVLFLHGRHSYCYSNDDTADGQWPCVAPAKEIPSQLGYDYLQQRLASQGYFTVSIRVNGINAQDDMLSDGGADARAKLVQAHLDYWAEAARASDHKLELDKVVLVGHSRGGEGVARAALQIPLSAGYRVAGAVLLAPTDFSGQTVPYVPTLTVLPYCDGDVYDLQGQRYTDAARDLVSDDTALHASVMVMGANHNYFNTEWTPGESAAPSWDDWWGDENAVCGAKHPERLSDAQQRSVGTAYVAAAAQVFTGTDDHGLALLDGSRSRVASTGDAVVLSHTLGGGRTVRAPGVDTGPTDATMDAGFCRGVTGDGAGHSICGRSSSSADASPHWPFNGEVLPERDALELAWNGTDQVGGMELDKPLDLDGNKLQLRTIVDPRQSSVKFKVRLTDADGASADLDPVDGQELKAFDHTEFISRLWAQAVTVDPTGAAIDTSRITTISLVSQSAKGRVWVLDAAAVPAILAAVPAKRIPLVSLGKVEELEGDDPEPRTVKVPFTLNTPVTNRSSIVVQVASYNEDQRSDLIKVNLAPGQKKGFVPVDVVGNTTPSLGSTAGFGLTAWAVRGVMTDAYQGSLNLQDDDPIPNFTLKAKKRTVKEGQKATWVLTMSEPLANDLYFDVTVVRGPKKVKALTGGDVTRSWRKAHGVMSTRKPLYKQGVWLPGELPAGSTKLVVSVPISKDGKKEGREQLTLQFRFYDADLTFTKTVYVAASKKGK